jgi:hypothetical protein
MPSAVEMQGARRFCNTTAGPAKFPRQKDSIRPRSGAGVAQAFLPGVGGQ